MKLAVLAPLAAVALIALPALAQAAAKAPPLPADGLREIEGKWYDEHRKVEVTVSNGVATITDYQTGHDFGHVPYADGTVVARLSGGAPRSDGRSYIFKGGCFMMSGGKLMLDDCGRSGATLSPAVWDGKPTYRFNLAPFSLYRADVLGPGGLAARD